MEGTNSSEKTGREEEEGECPQSEEADGMYGAPLWNKDLVRACGSDTKGGQGRRQHGRGHVTNHGLRVREWMSSSNPSRKPGKGRSWCSWGP